MSAWTRALVALSCTLIGVVLLVGLAGSEGLPLWQTNGVSIYVDANNNEDPQIVSDGSGGAIVVWAESGAAQRVDANGTVGWINSPEPVVLIGGSSPQIISDGAGGAIVTNGWDGNVSAQRVYSDGTRAWFGGAGGITNAPGSGGATIAPDGSGGAIVAWRVRHDGNDDIRAQRLDADGYTLWQINGVSIGIAVDEEGSYLEIVADEFGGAIVTWRDRRDDSDWDIYAQRVNADGNVLWYTNGLTICSTSGIQVDPQSLSDGSAGAIVVWSDSRNEESYYDIYAQRVYSDGTMAWTSDGVSLCVASKYQGGPQIISDGAGGAIVVWADQRDDEPYPDIYAQRVDATGNTLWATDGVSLCTASGDQCAAQAVSDGRGGAIVTWEDGRDYGTTYYDIYAQQVDSNGNVLWQSDGVLVSSAIYSQVRPQIATDGFGGAIVTWQDGRASVYAVDDIYAQRVGDLSEGAYLPVIVKRY